MAYTLEQYAELENSEIGEYLRALLDVSRFSVPHGMSETFKSALEEEMTNWLKRFQAETVVTYRVVHQPDLHIPELEWFDT
jgi:hypothetical protein